jgi:hypothetical protein
MKSTILFVIVFVIINTACKKQNNDGKNTLLSKKSYDDEINAAKFGVKDSGDEISYADLELYYLNNKYKKEEILPYTILMVEKHKKFKYSSKVFENLLDLYTGAELKYDGTSSSLVQYLKNVEKLDDSQRKYFFSFLWMGAREKSMSSVRYLEILNREGIGMQKNITTADSLKLQLAKLEIANHVK